MKGGVSSSGSPTPKLISFTPWSRSASCRARSCVKAYGFKAEIAGFIPNRAMLPHLRQAHFARVIRLQSVEELTRAELPLQDVVHVRAQHPVHLERDVHRYAQSLEHAEGLLTEEPQRLDRVHGDWARARLERTAAVTQHSPRGRAERVVRRRQARAAFDEIGRAH